MPSTVALEPSGEHRCRVGRRSKPSPEHQASYCLGRFEACERYVSPPVRSAAARESGARLPRWTRRFGGLALVGAVVLAGAVGLREVLSPARGDTPSTSAVQTERAADVSPLDASSEAEPSPRVERSPVASPSPEPAASRYVVRAGDGLIAVAEALGVSPEALMESNDLGPEAVLEVGQVLVVPAAAPGGAAEARAASEMYTVAPGDSLSSVALAHDVAVAELARANDLDPASPLEVGQRLNVPVVTSEAAP